MPLTLPFKPHDEDYHLASLLARAGHAARTSIGRVLGRGGGTWAQHALLVEASLGPGTHIRELARRLHLRRQSVHSAARALEQRGWVTIERTRPDPRRAKVWITRDGRVALARMAERIRRLEHVIARTVHPIPPAQLAALLRQISGSFGLGPTREYPWR
jgi:DNA-binding MarR family transcriptional regulator